jgi:hypothetical protein
VDCVDRRSIESVAHGANHWRPDGAKQLALFLPVGHLCQSGPPNREGSGESGRASFDIWSNLFQSVHKKELGQCKGPNDRVESENSRFSANRCSNHRKRKANLGSARACGAKDVSLCLFRLMKAVLGRNPSPLLLPFRTRSPDRPGHFRNRPSLRTADLQSYLISPTAVNSSLRFRQSLNQPH